MNKNLELEASLGKKPREKSYLTPKFSLILNLVLRHR